jgi:hypothetical protein
METNFETASIFHSNKTIPKLFADQELNGALRFISCAKTLIIAEPEKAFRAFTFDFFEDLEYLCFTESVFPPHVFLTFTNCSALKTLVFDRCKIYPNAWHSISQAIYNSSV